MRYLIIPILLISLTALNFISEDFLTSRNKGGNNTSGRITAFNKKEKQEIGKTSLTQVLTRYNFNIQFKIDKNIAFVKSKIVWKNKTDNPAKNLYLNFSRNFNKAENFENQSNSDLVVSKFSCSRKSTKPLFIKENSENLPQSLAKIKFAKPLLKGDSAILFIDYSFRIVSKSDSLELSQNKFTFVDDEWYPRIPIFENGKWQIFQNSKFTREYRGFANFNINISTPGRVDIITTGDIVEHKISNDKKYFNINQFKVNDYVIIAADSSRISKTKYKSSDFLLNIYTSNGNKNYIKRIKSAVSNSLSYLKNIGDYPYKDLSVFYLLDAEKLKNKTFSKTIIVNDDIFSSSDSYSFEELIGRDLAEQYFHFIVSNNSQTEAWLPGGISKYIGKKIKIKYYAENKATFKFLKYFPVNGLQFISYNGIPLVYTLGDYPIPQEANSLRRYYNGYSSGSIADSSYLFKDFKSDIINTVDKPFLLLLSCERIIGKEKMNKLLSEYYDEYKCISSKGWEFFSIIDKNLTSSTSKYLNQIYKGYDNYDLKVKEIERLNHNTYTLSVEATGQCSMQTDIKVYTNADTLSFTWDTSEKWSTIKFKSNSEVLAAEIDPTHKYIFDSNYSNNSYTLKRMNWSAISISIRWFFWIQNALMILGSVA